MENHHESDLWTNDPNDVTNDTQPLIIYEEDYNYFETTSPEEPDGNPQPDIQTPEQNKVAETAPLLPTISDPYETIQHTPNPTGCTRASHSCATPTTSTYPDTPLPHTTPNLDPTSTHPDDATPHSPKSAQEKVKNLMQKLPQPEQALTFSANELALKALTALPPIESEDLRDMFRHAFLIRIRHSRYKNFLPEFEAALLQFHTYHINLMPTQRF